MLSLKSWSLYTKIKIRSWSNFQENKNQLDAKCVFRKKEETQKKKKSHKFKARLVVKGFSQKKKTDYNKVLSLMVRHATIRVLLTLTTQLDMESEQLDVKIAFLHGKLKQEIYMKQYEGFKSLVKCCRPSFFLSNNISSSLYCHQSNL